MIEHANIFYVREICPIGGVETYIYELVRKFKNYDIAVVCKAIDKEQKRRLKKYCHVYIHTNQQINCKVIITNYDTSIIDYVNKDAKVYTGIHSDYSNNTQLGALPVDNPRITYIGITEDSKKKFEKLTGITDRTILCRNPLYLEKEEKPLILMSATRLTPEKGGDNLYLIAEELERQGINYIWFIFTTDDYKECPIWQYKNVIRIDPRFDLGYFYELADWYVQTSKCEGDSYSYKEALYRGTPIIACPLPYFKEYGIEDNKNALLLNFNGDNVKSVVDRMLKPFKVKFEPIKDNYDKILVKSKSHYKEDKEKKAICQCVIEGGYWDIELKRDVLCNEILEPVDLERANDLVNLQYVKILEIKQ